MECKDEKIQGNEESNAQKVDLKGNIVKYDVSHCNGQTVAMSVSEDEEEPVSPPCDTESTQQSMDLTTESENLDTLDDSPSLIDDAEHSHSDTNVEKSESSVDGEVISQNRGSTHTSSVLVKPIENSMKRSMPTLVDNDILTDNSDSGFSLMLSSKMGPKCVEHISDEDLRKHSVDSSVDIDIVTLIGDNAIPNLKSFSSAVNEASAAINDEISADVQNDLMQCSENETKTPQRTSQRRKQRKPSFEVVKDVAVVHQISPVKEKLPIVETEINWLKGDLVWSLVSGHPLWPCLVTCDPVFGIHTRMKRCGTVSFRSYHVQFFGDSPEHAWIGEKNTFKFTGPEQFEELVLRIAKSKTKKPPKVEISKRFKQNWNASIVEVMTALSLSNSERLSKYSFNYDKKYPQKVQLSEKISSEEKNTSSTSAGESTNIIDTALQKHTSKVKNSHKFKSLRKPKQPLLIKNQMLRKESGTAVDEKHGKSVFANMKLKNARSKKESSKIPKSNFCSAQCEGDENAALQKMQSQVYSLKIPQENGRTLYECLYCSDLHSSIQEMSKHCEQKHPENEEIVCVRKPTGKKHNRASPEKEQRRMNSEVSVNDSPSASTENHVKCEICGAAFRSKRSVGQHKRFLHGGVASTDDSKSSTETEVAKPNQTLHDPTPLNNKSKSDLATNIARNRSRLLIFSQAKKEPICAICENNGNTISCTGDCVRSFHAACVGEDEMCDTFVCKECKLGVHSCIICKEKSSEYDGLGALKRCSVPMCGRHFHPTCLQINNLKSLPEKADKVFGNGSNSRCPSHSCATCDSKALVEATSKGGKRTKLKPQSKSRLFKCIRCTTAYHIGDDCVAAGSVILGGLNIICPKHFNPVKSIPHHHQVHISWCFVCSKGGELMCCASCPAAFHAKCIDLEKPPEGDWHCLDCSCGVRPLYEDIVWVKLGTYRWWPGEVVHPNEVPDNIARLQHGPGEFVVRFFGSNDYFWLSKYRVFLYQEGDNVATNRHCSRGISGVFKKALQEAEERFSQISTERQRQEEVKTAKNDKKPAPYKHIRCNKPVGGVQICTAALNEIPKCACKRTDPHACGPQSECLNHMLMYECHPEVCPAGDRCENQRFQKCQYPETEIFKTEWGGWGLKTKTYVKKGSFVNEYVGELVDEEECRSRIERSQADNVTNFYMLTIDKDRIIDAGPKGNFSRFMNHCCDPNCETQKWMVNGDTRVGLFAVKDILPGDELTFNYNLDCLGNDKTQCLCGSKNCSGFLGVRPKPQCHDGIKREQKKKRKLRRLEQIPQHDDFCFRCRQTGTLVCCDFKGCLRAFCLDCLHIEKPPYGKWECPCHHCDWCGRRAQSFCSFCPNSFCGSHVQNQLRPSVPNRFDTCLDHNPETAEFEMAETVATVNDFMNASFSHGSQVAKVKPRESDKNRISDTKTEVVLPGKMSTDHCIGAQKRKRLSTGYKPEKRSKQASLE